MSSKQDLVGARTPADIERKYNFSKRFAEVLGVASDARRAAEEAAAKFKGLNADEIFNLLTNNGEVQGIYRDAEGNVYVNASYIVSGILRSKNGETFYLDLDNGVLKGQFSELSIGGKTVDAIAEGKAEDAAKNAVDAQTQEAIFNKLTNNGALEGLFMENGELYINASYLKSGIINAALVQAGVLQSKDGSSFYLDLDNGILKGKFSEFSISGKTVDEITQEKLDDFSDAVTKDIELIQSQIDGNITSWFYDHVPTTENEPANSWTTDELKNQHLGDLLYVVDNEEAGGRVYRWVLIDGVYKWQLVEDAEIAKALEAAAKAQDTADKKRRVFVVQPTPPYDIGDLWAQGESGDLKVCVKAKQTGTFSADDWALATDYINAETAKQIAQDRVDAQTHRDIFDKLTNKGAIKGIFMENVEGKDELYINASYLVTGILESRDKETFFLDLDNGILKGKFSELSIGSKTVDNIAQEKANKAESNASSYAKECADRAENNAKVHADSAASGAVNAQTQEFIFNKLTNGGVEQGIFLKDGQVYINARYIQSGSFTSTTQVFFEPGMEEWQTIVDHVNGRRAIPDEDIPLYDFNNDGVVNVADGALCIKAAEGVSSLAQWSGAVASVASVVIDATNLEKSIKISGTNMWGRKVEKYIGFAGASFGTHHGSLLVAGNLSVGGGVTFGDGTLAIGDGEPKALSWQANGDGTYTLIGRD